MPLSQYEPGSAAYHEAVVGVAQAIMQRIAQSTEEADRRRYLDPSWLSAMASTKGMRHLLEELYAHRTDPAVDQLYWSLLGAVRGEEQDWGDWFANFIATTGTK
jgi:hypothetical protein